MVAFTYVPVIKGKQNDLKAASRIRDETKPFVKPLVELIPVPSDVFIDDHLEKFAHNVVKHLSNVELFVDFYGFKPGANLQSGIDATIGGFRLLRSMGVYVTPTYGFERDDSLWTPLRTEVQKIGRGFCFRVDIDDLDDRSEETWAAILERSAELGLTPKSVDIFLDLRYVGNSSTEDLKNMVLDFLAFMPTGAKYRSIILSGSSALKHVGEVPKDGLGEIERKELRLWIQLQMDLHGFQKVIYSDYGVVNPEFSIAGPNKNANAKIRYTTSGKIKVYRGHRLMDAPGYKQYHTLSEEVRNSDDYMTREFSVGDRYLDDCADMNVKSGNLGTWVFNDMNHHVQFAALQTRELNAKIDAQFSQEQLAEVMELA